MKSKQPMRRDAEVGRRIRARRVSIGMSQSVLGEKIGVTFQQIQKYEKGLNRISSGRLEELSVALAVPVTYFFDKLDDRSAEVVELIQTANTAQSYNLLRNFSVIEDPSVRQLIVELTSQIASNFRKAGEH